MENNNEVEMYEKAIKALIEDEYPNLIGKAMKILEIGEQRIRFGISMPFASYTVSKEILNKYIYMNKEYRILQTKEVGDMENLINEYANQGWDPVGGISSQVINGAYCYNQTMVREKINESPDNGKQLLHG